MEIGDFIKLNVGGHNREMSKNSLLKIPVFEAVFNSDSVPSSIFIDRDATHFNEVISFVVWDIVPTKKDVTQEFEHYGISLSRKIENDDDIKRVEVLSTMLADQISSTDMYLDGPYYISACGAVYATTRRRLMEIGFFRGLFTQSMRIIYEGTVNDPYRTEIPPHAWHNILEHLRDKRHELLDMSRKMIEVLGGLSAPLITVPAVPAVPAVPVISKLDRHSALFDLAAIGETDHLFDGNISLWKKSQLKVNNSSCQRQIFVLKETLANVYEVDINRDSEYITKCYLNVPQVSHVDRVEFLANENILEVLSGYQIMMLQQASPVELPSSIIHVPFSFSAGGQSFSPLGLPFANIIIRVTLNIRQINPPNLILTRAFLQSNERESLQIDRLYPVSLFSQVQTFPVDENGEAKCNLKHISRRHTGGIFFTLHKDDSIESMFEPLSDCLIHYNLMFSTTVRCEGNETICKLDKIDSKINSNAPLYVIPFAFEPLKRSQHSMLLNMHYLDNVFLNIQVDKASVGCVRVWTNYWNAIHVTNGFISLIYD